MAVLELADLPVRVLRHREEVPDARGVDPLAMLDVALDRGEVEGAVLGRVDLLEPGCGGDADLALVRNRLEDACLLVHVVILLWRLEVFGDGLLCSRGARNRAYHLHTEI